MAKKDKKDKKAGPSLEDRLKTAEHNLQQVLSHLGLPWKPVPEPEAPAEDAPPQG
jgi:hypothetical protein